MNLRIPKWPRLLTMPGLHRTHQTSSPSPDMAGIQWHQTSSPLSRVDGVPCPAVSSGFAPGCTGDPNEKVQDQFCTPLPSQPHVALVLFAPAAAAGYLLCQHRRNLLTVFSQPLLSPQQPHFWIKAVQRIKSETMCK